MIRLVVVKLVRLPLSLRNVEDLLPERGIDLCHETVRLWWNRCGPMFAADILRQRVSSMRSFRHWRWHVDEVHASISNHYQSQRHLVDQTDKPLRPAALAEWQSLAA